MSDNNTRWELDRKIDEVIDMVKKEGFTKYTGELVNGWTFSFMLPKRNQKTITKRN